MVTDRARARRRQILEAAERVFGRAGYWPATTEEVAKEVGLTQPALYRYFPSKRALFLGALAFRQREMTEAFAQALASVSSPVERIRTVGHVAIELARQYPDMARLRMQASALAATDDEMRATVRTTLDAMLGMHAGLLRQGIEAGELSPAIDPERTAAVMTGQAFMMYFGLSLDHPGAQADEAHVRNDRFIDLLLRRDDPREDA